MKIHPDYKDFISALNNNNVRYVIVGAYALAFHGHPRATGDIDIWIQPERENATALLAALRDYGFESLNLTEEDILSGDVIQLGYAPVRIDLLTALSGLMNEEIMESREPGSFDDLPVSYLGREAFIKNKRSIGRHRDLADIELLGEL